MTLKVPYQIKPSGKWYIATCSVLDVVTQGETLAKARENLGQALTLFLMSCVERGTLEQVFKECGFRPDPNFAAGSPQPPDAEQEYLDIPIPLLADHMAGRERCHA